MGFFDKIKKSLIGEAHQDTSTRTSEAPASTSAAELSVDDNEDHTGYKAVVVQKASRAGEAL